MFKALANEFREIVRVAIGTAGWDTIRGLIEGKVRGEAKEAGVVAERIRTLIEKNPRADLLFLLLTMEPEERDAIWAEHKKTLAEGTENLFVTALGEALPRKDGKVDEERAKRILKAINELGPDDLRQALEFLKHDPIAQWIRYWILGKGKKIILSAAELAAFIAGAATPVAKRVWERRAEIDQKVGGFLNRIADRLERRWL